MDSTIIGVACAVAGFALKAIHEKMTREATDPLIQKSVDAAMVIARSEMSAFFNGLKDNLLDIISDDYMRSGGTHITGSELERRLGQLQDDVKLLRKDRHDSNQIVQVLLSKSEMSEESVRHNSQDISQLREKVASIDARIPGHRQR